ncbi:BamA/TamA family outer membrane protein [Flavobacterium sp. GT3R68]|uniref:translocation and assembly module lipoprotein TamL n=1 Tax=Flavobacterium sp. GT3R68 TaxID=2594437 RepID=UPI000F85E48D|nr:BamA/TamA family outer membrane protein [Flavobacterium sp. GT3R68]RTY92459.1 outer membrane protein assembly factor [Flavobacterium sp. GSN2]TRW94084.1 BamA/TamA family outer membrane protein [Flavobacterium sp. GT3R68]
MRNIITKISLFILIGIIISGCNAVKRVPDGKQLLIRNKILTNGKKEKDEEVSSQLYQKPNSKIFGYRLRLNLYNIAKKNPDSVYKAKFIKNPSKYKRMAKLLSKKQVDRLGKSFWYFGIHNFLKRTGEPPVIIEERSTKKSATRLKSYYFNQGYFSNKTTYKLDSLKPKKGQIQYMVITGNPWILDTINTRISTPALDSLYQKSKGLTFLKTGKQYKKDDLDAERIRITTNFRNNGVFHFQPNFITYNVDTLNVHNKVNLDLVIDDYNYREGDSTQTVPFKIYKISEVNIFTDGKAVNTDSTTYKNFNLYSATKLKYRPKAITDAVFITKGSVFADFRTTLTSRYLSNLRVFNYPSIQYRVDTRDTIKNSLIADIYLTSRKKYHFGAGLDFTHSNIQDFGIVGSTSLTIRNIFRGAETLELAARGNIGSSKALANPDDNFFNVSEYGFDMKLNFPRIFFPLNTERIIPKNMIPSTSLSLGYAKQRNIGLDKENFTSVLSYNWNPKRNTSVRFDLFNIQYVKNVNTGNYFNVYLSSYGVLNDLANIYLPADSDYFDDPPNENNLIIETGTTGFINDVLSNPSAYNINDFKTIKSIEERRQRLTENNLIFATSYGFSKTSKTDLNDNEFYVFKTKMESAGNFLSLLANTSRQLKNQNGNRTIFDVEYSQYFKTEFEYIKHWDLKRKRVFAMRAFAGIAIPYGNSESVPFSRSYFAGGSNDNRAWKSYGLGPGSSGATNDFNEANMKLALSAEIRFNLFGDLNGAFFVDAGNIWNVLDNVEDEKSVFSSLKSLENSAIGSGFGLRYDFNFFVVRLDFGFKTYNPADEVGDRWFRDYNFSHSVLNIGINYPF